MMIAPLFAVVISASLPCTVTAHDEITFDTPLVQLADVVTLECVDPAQRAPIGAQTLLNLSERAEVRLSRSAIASLARRRAPLLRFVEEAPGQVRLRLAPQSRSAVAARTCLRLLRSLEADTILAADMVVPVACADPVADAPLRRDAASGFARTIGPIEAGAIIPQTLVAPRARTRKGDALTLVVEAGPVRISRPVQALQDAAVGERVFVRDGEGEVFSMPLGDHTP